MSQSFALFDWNQNELDFFSHIFVTEGILPSYNFTNTHPCMRTYSLEEGMTLTGGEGEAQEKSQSSPPLIWILCKIPSCDSLSIEAGPRPALSHYVLPAARPVPARGAWSCQTDVQQVVLNDLPKSHVGLCTHDFGILLVLSSCWNV